MMIAKKTILLLTDFSKTARRAADLALELAVNNHADLLLYNSVVPLQSDIMVEGDTPLTVDLEDKKDKGLKKLMELEAHLRSKLTLQQQATTAIAYKQGFGGVIQTIITLVEENQIWMVVMGAQIEKGIAMLNLNNNVPAVLNNCSCPLLLVP